MSEREAFLFRLRESLVQAINGNPITIADSWDILREWDRGVMMPAHELAESDRGETADEQR